MRPLARFTVRDAWQIACLTAGFTLLGMGVAEAALPIPQLEAIITETEDTAINQGGVLAGIGGLAAGAFKMAFSSGEFGIGQLMRTGGGCAMVGATPSLTPFFLGGGGGGVVV